MAEDETHGERCRLLLMPRCYARRRRPCAAAPHASEASFVISLRSFSDRPFLPETESHSYRVMLTLEPKATMNRASDVGGNAEEKLGSGRMDGKSQPDRSAALRILPEPTRSSQGQDAGEGIPSSKVFVLVVYRSWLGTSTASRPRRVPPLVCYPSNPRVLICARVIMVWG